MEQELEAGRKVLRTEGKPRMVYVDTKVRIEDELVWDGIGDEMMKKCMEKPIVNMVNWELYEYDGHYNLSGTADRHPRLGNYAYVKYTSNLQRYSMEEDTLVYETLNTIYRCPLKYLTTTPYRNVLPAYKQQLAQRTEQSDSALDKIIAVSAKMSLFDYSSFDYSADTFLAYVRQLQIEGQKEIREQVQKENERLTGIAGQYEDCVYLEVSNIASGDKLAYHLGSQMGTVEPYLHSGMFQDSVLYVKYRGESGENDPLALDFRYFPTEWGNVMKTYSWSDNIKRAVIKNMKDDPIIFNQQMIQPGETKVVTPEKVVKIDSE